MRSEQDVIDQLADYFGWLETQLDVESIAAPSPDRIDQHGRPHVMHTSMLSIPGDVVETNSTTATDWTAPSVIAGQAPRRTVRALLMAAAALMVVAGLWTLSGRGGSPDQPGAASMRLDGSSMAPTLLNGDTLQIDTNAYKTVGPGVGDIVEIRTFDAIGEQHLVKRVVAVAGQTIEYRTCVLSLDGVEQPELSITTPPPSSPSNCGADQPALLIPVGHVFVLGDNRRGLQGQPGPRADSRDGPAGPSRSSHRSRRHAPTTGTVDAEHHTDHNRCANGDHGHPGERHH